MSADLAALADEALYAEQWLLQGQPVGSLTPGASKMRDIEAALRTLAAADEKMPVAACLAEESGTVSKLVRSTDAQAAVLAAAAAERERCANLADPPPAHPVTGGIGYDSLDMHHYAEARCAERDAEIERLRALTHCGCGDQFTVHDPGACINCVIGMTALKGEPDAN